MARRGRILDWAGESRYYSEPKRLAGLGYLSASKETGRTHARTVYRLTPRGTAAVRAWARTPATFTPVKSEPLVRLLVADIAGPDATRQGLSALRPELADLHARVAESEASAEALPHRRAYLLLVAAFLHELLDLYAGLLERADAELARAAADPGP